MNIRKYFWSLNKKAIRETESILKKPDHPKFAQRMYTILSRCDNPKEVFTVIDKKLFINVWPRIRQYWTRTSQYSDFRAFWETVYEALLKKTKTVGIKKGPIGIPVQEFQSIGKLIKNSRINKNWTQSDFAHRTGIKQPDISAIEKGKKNITLSTLIHLCRTLDIKLIEL